MSELTLNVPAMSCGHCEASIKGEVGKVTGVRDITVDLTGKIVTVTGDDLQRDAIVAAIDEAGFEVVG